jgi:ectoine hydroxylase-related dioxygenase (phytanoyl-CoA dioxygenase family)
MKECLLYKPNFSKIQLDLQAKGYSCIENVVNDEFVSGISSIVDNQSLWHNGGSAFHGNKAVLVPNLVNKSTHCLDIAANSSILEIANEYFRDGAHREEQDIFQLLLMHGRIVFENAPPQELHIDSRCCGVNPPSHLHFFLYLDDCLRPGDGATQFVPGSHRFTRYPDSSDMKYAEELYAKKGTLVVLNSATYHGSSAKSTPGRRRLLSFAYSRWFIRQPFAIPYAKEWPRKLTENEKLILGFKNYGTIDGESRISARGSLPRLIPTTRHSDLEQ